MLRKCQILAAPLPAVHLFTTKEPIAMEVKDIGSASTCRKFVYYQGVHGLGSGRYWQRLYLLHICLRPRIPQLRKCQILAAPLPAAHLFTTKEPIAMEVKDIGSASTCRKFVYYQGVHGLGSGRYWQRIYLLHIFLLPRSTWIRKCHILAAPLPAAHLFTTKESLA